MTAIRDWVNLNKPGGLRHWHIHVAIVLVLLIGISIGVAGTLGVQHASRGGFIWAKPHNELHISGGPQPASYSLDSDVDRIHNQGTSNSCVGQTVSTIEEILQGERHARNHHYGRKAFSAGYVYDQINGGVDGGANYPDAFNLLVSQGDAPYAAFPYDGAGNFWVQPWGSARASAYRWRATSWRYVSPADVYTIEYEIAHGRPLGIAFEWYSSLVNAWGSSAMVYGQSGYLAFRHSVTIVAYNRYGVEILNSWGPAYGQNGRLWLSWSMIGNVGATIAVFDPALGMPAKPNPFHVKVWNQYRAAKHWGPIAYKQHGKLLPVAREWNSHHPAKLGGVVKKQWFGKTKTRKRPYLKWSFQAGSIYVWRGRSFKVVHHTWRKP